MRSTLLIIPHEIFGWPLFGVGIALGILVVSLLAWLAYSLSQGRKPEDLIAATPMWAIAAAIIVFVLPNVEMTWSDGEPIGLPIRGYGIFVLLGLLAGIGLSVYRGRQLGIDPDTIVGLGFWMMMTGVVGARLFYVFQKWELDFAGLALKDQLIGILKVTEGGLVIYGGVIGGLAAALFYCWRHQMRPAAVADLVAPGFLIGLAFGRIGCLLHGCCFGGICNENLPTLQYPHASVPYISQLATGRLIGFKTDGNRLPAEITEVTQGSLAEAANLKVGQIVDQVDWAPEAENKERDPALPPPVSAVVAVDGQYVAFPDAKLPERSLPAHPSQIYSAVNALLLCCLAWFLQPIPSRDGIAFCISIILYASSRFLLEGVRSDEGGQLGTSLSIAQLVGIFAILLALAGLFVISRMKPARIWAWSKI